MSHSWSRQGAGTHPAASSFLPPSPPLHGAAKGHVVKLLVKGKSHWDGAKPLLGEPCCPLPASTWASSGSAVIGSAWHMEKARSEPAARPWCAAEKPASPLGRAESRLLGHGAVLGS